MKDIIYREDAIDTLVAIFDKPNHPDYLRTDEICNALNFMPSAQPTQSNDSNTLNALDCISRQAAIGAHCELCPDNGKCNCDICPDVEAFQFLPSAQPEYELVTAETFAREMGIASINSALEWISLYQRLNEMGYAICKKKMI